MLSRPIFAPWLWFVSVLVLGAVTLHAANVLIKFMVGDLEFRDTEGRPFKISSHLYRHAGQTAEER